MKNIVILGSTGSIGKQSIEVCEKMGFKIVGLAANNSVNELVEQAKKCMPQKVCIYNEEHYIELKEMLSGTGITVTCGMEGLCELAGMNDCDIVLNSVVGMVGLKPTMAAIEAKKTVALANKETLVTGGELVLKKAKEKGVDILPVDSEHSAIFQCSHAGRESEIEHIILTASGGPFLNKTRKELETVTVKDALNHPNWSMGAKITTDSATLMNKGLELIEACHLFSISAKDVEIVVHPQSIIHSCVEFKDHAVIAQMSNPDMKLPIQYALTYPNRCECDIKPLSLTDCQMLTFQKPDEETFECLKACKLAFEKGGLYPTLVNGANEQAVEMFLNNKISFLDIGKVVMASLEIDVSENELTVENIIKTDIIARNFVKEFDFNR